MPQSENTATSPASNLSAPAPAPAPKLRSCVVCRSRKVRCDKLSPCSNCRRANIACVLPNTDRPPRWARRLERNNNNAAASNPPAQVMDRLRNLESLVKELRGQLEEADGGAASSSDVNSPGNSSHDRDTDHQRDISSNTDATNLQKPFGRLVLQDANKSRYVSSAFWSRVNDELDGLDPDTSEDEVSSGKSPSTQEFQRTPSERHAFLFKHNLSPSAPDLREFHPLPSQIPFLLDVFSENINSVARIVHIPTVAKMIRDSRDSHTTSLTPANEALMFSIYYAAVTSMEEDDIVANFGLNKTDLNLKFRLGLEHALARADFLNVPDLVLVQAFTIFLTLVRRHDSPRFVWMMTGLAVRMAQALGLHRDPSHFKHLTPYEMEMRRRIWWALCTLDVRASEDQGTEYTIASGSFDTRLPLNINDADIEPNTAQMPTAREGITDMTFGIISIEISEVTKKMMALSGKDGASNMEEQTRLLNEIYEKVDRGYLRYSIVPGNIVQWVGATIARLVMGKMTLLVALPILFSSPSESSSDGIKSNLLVAAIEVAEYNHALNAEQACRHWRWLFQTYTHWYAVVHLLIECSKQPWSPIIERAWVALHSEWLIPPQSHLDQNVRVWLPLRRLMAKAGKHRDAELERLRSDPQAAERLEMEDRRIPVPSSPGPFPAGSNVAELFRERWRQLLQLPEGPRHSRHKPQQSGSVTTTSSPYSTYTTQMSTSSIPEYNAGSSRSDTTLQPAYLSATGLETSPNLLSTSPDLQPARTTYAPGDYAMGQTEGPSYNTVPAPSADWSLGPGFAPWLWPEAEPSVDAFANVDADAFDVNMDLDGVDWYSWVESAKGMEMDIGRGSNGPAS